MDVCLNLSYMMYIAYLYIQERKMHLNQELFKIVCFTTRFVMHYFDEFYLKKPLSYLLAGCST
jgi:hypothetical protein